MAEFAYNNWEHSATKESLFYLNYGFNPEFQILEQPQSNLPTVKQRLEELVQARKEAQAALEVAARRMKQQYDQHVAQTPPFTIGDLVWLDASNIHLTGTRKLNPKRLGPYKIVEKINDLAYKLQLPESMHIHPVFHASLLYPVHKDTIEGRIPPEPEPVEIEGEEEYEVEKILDVKKAGRQLQYLVKWKGWGEESNSWEPKANLKNAPLAIQDFYEQYPQALR